MISTLPKGTVFLKHVIDNKKRIWVIYDISGTMRGMTRSSEINKRRQLKKWAIETQLNYIPLDAVPSIKQISSLSERDYEHSVSEKDNYIIVLTDHTPQTLLEELMNEKER